MQEKWDLYDKNGNLLERKANRGEKLLFGEYHLVVNAWIVNDNNEFLITRRSAKKSHPLMWECTGGSALLGETSQEAAIREVKEELGITVKEGIFIGRTRRYYPNRPDILDVWLFHSNVDINEIKVQEEEVCEAKWASVDEIKRIYNEGSFEANPFIEEALGIK